MNEREAASTLVAMMLSCRDGQGTWVSVTPESPFYELVTPEHTLKWWVEDGKIIIDGERVTKTRHLTEMLMDLTEYSLGVFLIKDPEQAGEQDDS